MDRVAELPASTADGPGDWLNVRFDIPKMIVAKLVAVVKPEEPGKSYVSTLASFATELIIRRKGDNVLRGCCNQALHQVPDVQQSIRQEHQRLILLPIHHLATKPTPILMTFHVLVGEMNDDTAERIKN